MDDLKDLAEAIRATLANATEGAWQWGEAGRYNFVAFDGSDIVAVASFRAKSDADLAGLMQQNAGKIADALAGISDETNRRGKTEERFADLQRETGELRCIVRDVRNILKADNAIEGSRATMRALGESVEEAARLRTYAVELEAAARIAADALAAANLPGAAHALRAALKVHEERDAPLPYTVKGEQQELTEGQRAILDAIPKLHAESGEPK